ICFSHLRWDFVFQRPQHLMTRFAKTRSVIYWEEPLDGAQGEPPRLNVRECHVSGVVIATPILPADLSGQLREVALRQMLDAQIAGSANLVRWYYTPMMLPFSRHLQASCTVYDCMDELANFKFAPPELLTLEAELLIEADVVFTGGYSLWEAKRDRHANIHPFPSSVDQTHFAQARINQNEPADQAAIPLPRLGFFGVVDERMDLELLASIADARPHWSIVVVGPVVKIDPAELPARPNLHFLGGKSYSELPAYLSGWNVALMPFAVNAATQFISPTKTPEYLAGGRPVVSTPITDVARHYSQLEAVMIARDPEAFVLACEDALALDAGDGDWLKAADAVLATMSWDETFAATRELVSKASAKQGKTPAAIGSPVVWPADRPSAYDYLVVGAGFAGSVLAERLTTQLGKRVLLVDRRPHVGGNAYDERDAAGILMHRYGPHIFHTNSDEVFAYLSQFTRWRPYEHRVLANVRDGLRVPVPINRTTLNTLYGLDLKSDADAEAYLRARAEPVDRIRTSEDVVISQVGRELYETFFQGYTRKQWGMDPSELDKSVTARVPTRVNTDDRYFTDKFQAMPADGYTAMFDNMLDQKGLDVEVSVEFEDVRDELIYDHLIFTGPIDEYFDHRYGRLPYRSLEFRHQTLDQPWFQEVGTVNYPDEATPYTRISEYKHLTGQQSGKTTITYEYPRADGDPYYPVPRPENQALFKQYEALALATPNVSFVGRLATYRYYNMDQVTGQALATFRRIQGANARTIQPLQAIPAGIAAE
ncbi:MAG: UDP-galactopyranose mutase, partial [Phenylobacterium sp.]|uniref:UDP-galactopyranose mutase n=1 Tax=Phenylobacterium sp. TaxID=1871053 RepID=UPI002735FF0E